MGAVVGGRYRVTARLGAGGMATIYRAIDESLERDVAIKALHPHLADDPSVLARFRAEARAAAGLLHPNIVNVFDQGTADLPFIVMEYVDGPSLREVLLRRGRLTPGEVLAVATPVCHALARAHAAGVIHRDIKPENILIAADGTPKVADFGIARAIAETSHTATGTLVGSVHYLAPELLSGQEATERTDQYSLGVVLFELLTGRKPLPAETPMAVAMRHARERIPPVRDFVSDAPAALDGVIARATAQRPDRRYDDMASLVAALTAAVPGGPTPVVLDDEVDNGTLVIPVATEDTVTVPTGTSRVRRRRRRLPSLRRRGSRPARRRPLLLAVLAAVLLLAGAGGFALWNWVIAPVAGAPELIGMTREAAESAGAEAGLTVLDGGTRHDLEVPPGHVVDQRPAPGAPLRRGAEIALVISSGPAEVTIPDLSGRPAQRWLDRLEQAPYHLDVAVRRQFSDRVPRGRIIGHQPEAETTVLQGTEITVRVSRGIEQVEVPEVVGQDRGAATQALEAAKLTVEVTEQYSDAVPQAGTVISQSVEPGQTVDKGTAVALVVSAGPQTFAIDSYEGQGVGQAREALQALGMQVRVVEQARPQIGPFRRGTFGRVEAQVPEAGTQVERGETVTLYTFSQNAEREADD